MATDDVETYRRHAGELIRYATVLVTVRPVGDTGANRPSPFASHRRR